MESNIIEKEVKESFKNLKESFNLQEKEVDPIDYTLKIEKIQEEMDRLRKAGLSGSSNFKKLYHLKQDFIEKRDDLGKPEKEKAELRKFVMEILDKYPKAIIISWQDFFDICQKYGLNCGSISEYKKTIPEENIQEVLEASKTLGRLENFYNYRITKVEIKKEATNDEKYFLKNYFSIFPFAKCEKQNNNWNTWTYISFLDISLKKKSLFSKTLDSRARNFNPFNRVTNDSGSSIIHDWCIAAPPKDLDETIEIKIMSSAEERRLAALKDPIIFKSSKYGPIIVSMWGEEANDSIFDKFK